MIDPRFVWVGAALALFGGCFYANAVITGMVRPHLVTWILWATMPMIAFFAQLNQGVGLSAVLTLSTALGPIMVVVSSVFVARSGYWRLSRTDVVCAVISVAAIALWLGLDAPLLAIVLVIVADSAAAIPTVVKSWHSPHTERSGFYLLAAANGAITLLTLHAWTPAEWMFPVYIVTIASTVALIVHIRSRSLRSRSAPTPTPSDTVTAPMAHGREHSPISATPAAAMRCTDDALYCTHGDC